MSSSPRYVMQAVPGSQQIFEGDEERNTGPRIGIEIRVVEGPDAGKTGYWYGSLKGGESGPSGKTAQDITVETLRLMGWTCNDITALEGLGSVKFIGLESKDVYKGRPQTRWKIFEMNTPAPRLEADRKAGFAAQFKALAASVPVAARNTTNAASELPAKLESTGNSTGSTQTTPGAIPF